MLSIFSSGSYRVWLKLLLKLKVVGFLLVLVVSHIAASVGLRVVIATDYQLALVKLELLTSHLGFVQLVLKSMAEECRTAISCINGVAQSAVTCIYHTRFAGSMCC